MRKLCELVLQALEGKTLATAESCTGGGIGAALTAVPGSSQIYQGGVISYSNAVKRQLLGVDQAVLELHGPVSAQVAEAMVRGVQNLLHTDAALSVTGLAGPGGDSYGNPVGTVYVGCIYAGHLQVQRYQLPGDRETVRSAAAQKALKLLLEMIGK